ncbi:unnamed protein product [Adineta ricciae]|uniref:Uncharacterized protein n=1 Tax=Adineta ricciae TaxID=249248 RepID=A0A815VKU5_ADIRI|nr:unnamed protein product [Adineta ricciae]CAF1531733.1 unnamed protein product [Adineta ricciae]
MGIIVHNTIDEKQDEDDREGDLQEMSKLFPQQQHYFYPYSQQMFYEPRVLHEKLEELSQKHRKKENRMVQDRVAILPTSSTEDLTPYKKNGSADFSSILSPSDDIFINGIWSNHFYQYGAWHGPFKCSMNFNANNNTFHGDGEDVVGLFILSGLYSKETKQMQIIQSYKYGTGNPQLNFGHQCVSQMTWNPARRVFEGIMFVSNGWTMIPGGLFEISFVKSH